MFSKGDVWVGEVVVEVEAIAVKYWLESVSAGECGVEGIGFHCVGDDGRLDMLVWVMNMCCDGAGGL